MRLTLCGSLVALAVLGCSSPRAAPVEPAEPRPSAKPPPQAASAGASVLAPTAPPSAPRPQVRARLAHLEIGAPEPRLYAAPIVRALPTIQVCLERAASASAAPMSGWVIVNATLATSGKLTAVEVDGSGLTGAVPPCVGDALRAVSSTDLPGKDAAVSMWISIAGPEPEGLDHLDPQEELLRAENGLCAGREVTQCKPRKMCATPRERPVACPELNGLPGVLDLAGAERRLDLGVSGGKTGQGAERVMLYASRGQCAALKIKTDITGPQPTEQRETVDVPCTAFERTLKLAESRLLGRRPRGDEKTLHAVGKSVSFWKTGKDGVPTVTELQWVGPDAADEAFSIVASEAAKAVTGRGTLALSRFRE